LWVVLGLAANRHCLRRRVALTEELEEHRGRDVGVLAREVARARTSCLLRHRPT
jgi:hypothetical protein